MKAVVSLLASLGMAQAMSLQVETESRRFSCSQPGSSTILGSVVETGRQTFVLDQCLPTQDCQKVIRASLSISAPEFIGFQKYLVKDGFVRVQVDIRKSGNLCQERVLIGSMSKWLGAPNPAGGGDRFYFASGAETTAAFQDSPFTMQRCPQNKQALRLRDRAGSTHDAKKGETSWQVSGAEKWTIRLLGLGACGSDAKWSYWVAGQPR